MPKKDDVPSSRFEEATLWELAGPAAGEWFALVLSGAATAYSTVSQVLVVPAKAGVPRTEVTDHDVVCDAAASPLRECLTFAAWATAPIPAHCLKREVGRVDQRLVVQVKKAHETLSANPAFRGYVHRSRPGEPAWHNVLRESLSGYWDGSVTISCATLPEAEAEAAS